MGRARVLTAEQVHLIRTSSSTDVRLADELQVSRSSIRRARIGINYAEHPTPPRVTQAERERLMELLRPSPATRPRRQIIRRPAQERCSSPSDDARISLALRSWRTVCGMKPASWLMLYVFLAGWRWWCGASGRQYAWLWCGLLLLNLLRFAGVDLLEDRMRCRGAQ